MWWQLAENISDRIFLRVGEVNDLMNSYTGQHAKRNKGATLWCLTVPLKGFKLVGEGLPSLHEQRGRQDDM